MDRITEQLVTYGSSFSASSLSESALRATEGRLFDSIACALPGSGSEPARILARVGSRIRSDRPATVFGYGVRTSPEVAALANAGMIRTFDWNDGGVAVRGGGHSSDMISGVLAAAETAHATGLDTLAGIALAYELLNALGFEVSLKEVGFDQGTFMSVAVALAAGRLWQLSEEQLANAASLALVPNLPLSVSRWGELSMMKGFATAFGTRSGVFAAMLAAEGFTSAPEPFSGIYGLQHITGEFNVELPLFEAGRLSIEVTDAKYWPAEGNVQGLLELVPRIREWGTLAEIDSIEVTVAERLVIHLADEPKYDPRTRETADHSLPFMLIVALQDGEITLNSYSQERILDPALRPLMRKVRVLGSRQYEEEMRGLADRTKGTMPPRPARIRIMKSSGECFEEEVLYPLGHASRPLNREQLNHKLDLAAEGIFDNEEKDRLRKAWWGVAKSPDISEQMKTMAGFRRLD